MTAIDLTGGMDASVDEVAATPSGPQFMEGANVWIWDSKGRVALPRIAVDAIGARWDEAHSVSLNGGLPGGRVLMLRDQAPPHPCLDASGRPRVRGAGPLRFECVEPFRHWRVTFDGLVGETTTEAQIAHRAGGPGSVPVPDLAVRLDIDLRMSAPPWTYGTHDMDGTTLATEQRLEQLCRARGTVEIDGTVIDLDGGALRVRRKGGLQRSDYSDWMGHVWMSSQFPSGRAFGIDHFHPRPDGSVRFHEGWVLQDGELMPAKFVDTPWKRSWIAGGEDVSFTLRTPRGEVRIDGVTSVTTVNPVAQAPAGTASFPATQQGLVRYTWDGEHAFGMMERSAGPQ